MADLGPAFARGGVVGQINKRAELGIARSAVEQKRTAAAATAQTKQIAELKEDTKALLEIGISTINQANTPELLENARQFAVRSFEGVLKRAETLGAPPSVILAAQNRLDKALSQKEAAIQAGAAKGAGTAAEQVTQAAALIPVVGEPRARKVAGLGPEPLGDVAARTRTEALAAASVTPKLVTFFMPKTKKTVTVNVNDPDVLDTTLEEGGIKFTATTEATDPTSAFDLQKPEIREFREATIASEVVLSETARLRQQLRGGDTFTGLLGSTVRGFSNAVGNLVQLARRQHGTEEADKQLATLDPAKYADSLQSFISTLGDPARSQAFVSNAINLAFIMARAANPDGRLSDADVQFQMERLAAGSGDQNQILSSLDEVDRATRANFAIRHRVFGGAAVLGEIPARLRVGGGIVNPADIPAVDLRGMSNEELLQEQRRLTGGF